MIGWAERYWGKKICIKKSDMEAGRAGRLFYSERGAEKRYNVTSSAQTLT